MSGTNCRKIDVIEWIGIILMLAFMGTVAFLISSTRGTEQDKNDLYEYLLEVE